MKRTARIVEMANQVARAYPTLLLRRTPGRRPVVDQYMRAFGKQVDAEVGAGMAEQRISGSNEFRVDFYVEEDAAVIEIEFNLPGSHSNFERDIFKILLARDTGRVVKTLVLVGPPGSRERLSEAGPKDIITWVKKHHRLDVQVLDLGEGLGLTGSRDHFE
jgi:hypothetical protein